jgi:hypothetical protein|tara:strand:+ start:123 stop:368 length:246 start_codon:yes stop_codon:yes gene_type:complete
MDDHKMRFVDYLWAAVLFMLAMFAASCVSEENQTVCLEVYWPVCAEGEMYHNECYAYKAGYENDELTEPVCELNTAQCKCD